MFGQTVTSVYALHGSLQALTVLLNAVSYRNCMLIIEMDVLRCIERVVSLRLTLAFDDSAASSFALSWTSSGFA
jgi:hypothetical protein